MQIQKVTVTNEEVNEAVQEYINSRFGVSLKVKNVTKKYTWEAEHEVEIEVNDKRGTGLAPALQNEPPASLDEIPEELAVLAPTPTT